MDYDYLISMQAISEDNNNLGEIIRIDNLFGKKVKKHKHYAVVLVKRFLKKDVLVPIAISKLSKVEDNLAWFDITKDEFRLEERRIRNIKDEKDIYPTDAYIYTEKSKE
ncbi:MAG: hypothetical protein ACFFDW_12770 [Candidatus Thorarchaeota archaeon]